MATENRRVAAYLPPEVSDAFLGFKIQRGLATNDKPNSNDSQALILILSEFLGVSQRVAHSVDCQSSFVTKEELNELNLKVAHLTEQIQSFDCRLEQAVSKATCELKSELLDELPKQEITEVSPGQLELLSNRVNDQNVEALSQLTEMPRELLGGLSGRALAERFSKKKSVSRHAIERRRESPDFSDWSKMQDPQDIAWEYRSRKYYPI